MNKPFTLLDLANLYTEAVKDCAKEDGYDTSNWTSEDIYNYQVNQILFSEEDEGC